MKKGFSLIEILVVLFIISIVAVFLFPVQQNLLTDAESQKVRGQLLQTIRFARIAAMSNHHTIILCKSADQMTCSGEWANGFIVLSNNHVLKSTYLQDKGHLIWRGLHPDQKYLKFSPDGMMQGENGTFSYYSANAMTPAWSIVISRSGRARVVLPTVL